MSGYKGGDEPIPGYRLVEFLGRGSFGEVWRATGPGGTETALKFIALDNKQGIKEFRAIGLVKRLRHPNLCPVQAIWLRDSAGNVMSDAVGGDPEMSLSSRVALTGSKELVMAIGLGDASLASRAEETRLTGGIPIRQLLRYMEGAARGIDYLNEPRHAPGNTPIIHCDIKPANLLVVGGDVQVCDYGVARALGGDAKKTVGAGTPAYAAPELINNDPCPQTDQYSLAITYFELRTGRLPFDEAKALVANLTGALDLSALDPEERAVIARATSHRPDQRYPTAEEMVEELKVACGVSMTRSAVVPRPVARRLPAPAPPPAPPTWPAADEAKATPAGTVTFPDRVRETPAAARPSAPAARWAAEAAPGPAAGGSRRVWVGALVGGLVLAAGAVGAFILTRPGPTEPTDPPPNPPGGSPPAGQTAPTSPTRPTGAPRPIGPTVPTRPTVTPPTKPSDSLEFLRTLRVGTADEIDDAAGKVEALFVSPPNGLAANKIAVALRDHVRPGLTRAADGFAWAAELTAPRWPLPAGEDPAQASRWFARAGQLAARMDDAALVERFAQAKVRADLTQQVTAKTDGKNDVVGRYEAARPLSKDGGVSAAVRYAFTYRPAAVPSPTDGLDALPPNQRPRAARLLVALAVDALDDTGWSGAVPAADVRRADADRLLLRAADASAITAAEEVARLARPPLSPGFASKLGKAADATEAPAAARQLYEQAIRTGGKHTDAAGWHNGLASLILDQTMGKIDTVEEARSTMEAIGRAQTAYLLVAEEDPPQADARRIVTSVSELQKRGKYGTLAKKLAAHEEADPALVRGVVAELKYMQSGMGKEDGEKLRAAGGDIPADASEAARASRDRIARLARAPTLDALRRAYTGADPK